MYKLGDTVRVYEKDVFDPSPEAMLETLRLVLKGESPPLKCKDIVLTTQEMVDDFNNQEVAGKV